MKASPGPKAAIPVRLLAMACWPVTFAVVGGLLWFALRQLTPEMGTMPYVGIWLHLILLGYMGGMIWLFTRPLRATLRTNLVLLLIGCFFLAILTVKLLNTPFTVGGINGDARFYTTYITKLAHYPGYGDMFYQGLPSFYPPLYYFVVARAADWLAIAPYLVMKPALLVTVLSLPLLTAALWRRLVDERLAAAVALCMLVFPDWFKPNEWLALVCFVPWWLHWVDNVSGYRPQTRRAHLWWWIGGSLIGALIFQLYFFWFFVGGVTFVVKAGWWLLARRSDRQLRWQLINALLMLTITALASSPFWLPYLYSMFEANSWRPLQNRWFSDSKVPLPLDFLQNDWQGVVYLGGLVYLVLAAPQQRVERGLFWLFIGFWVWVAVGYVAVLIDMPLLTFRSYPMLRYLLGAGAFLGLFRLWHGEFALRTWVTTAVPWQGTATTAVPWQRTATTAVPWQRTATTAVPWQRAATVLLLLVVLLFANSVVRELQQQENVQDAVDATYPAAELATFDQLTANSYRDRVALVSDPYRSMLFFRPIYSFLAWSAHFSHPAADFHGRVEFLQQAAQLHDPALFAAAVHWNRYDTIDYFLLQPEAEHWRYRFVDDNFPRRVVDRDIYFPRELLVEPHFTTHAEGDYTLFRLGPAPAVVALPSEATTAAGERLMASPLVDVARVYVLLSRFAAANPTAAHQSLLAVAAERLLAEELTSLPLPTLLDLYAAATDLNATALADVAAATLATSLGLDEPVVLHDAAGTARLRLLGYSITEQPLVAEQEAAEQEAAEQEVAEQEVAFDFYFEVLAPLSQEYTIWVHLFPSAGGKLVLDHKPVLPTTAWVPGQIYRDRYVATLGPAEYQLDVGVWEAQRDERLWANGEPGITLGEFTLPTEPRD